MVVRPPEEATESSYRRTVARSLYRLERWQEARELYEGLAAESSDSVRYLGMLGLSAARVGDTAAATAPVTMYAIPVW